MYATFYTTCLECRAELSLLQIISAIRMDTHAHETAVIVSSEISFAGRFINSFLLIKPIDYV